MKNKHLWAILFIVFLSFNLHAQKQAWRAVIAKDVAKLPKADRASIPETYDIFQLDLSKLKQSLQNAPLDQTAKSTDVVVAFPTAQGKMERFEIYQAPVMSAVLSQKYPEISSYSGKSIDNPTSAIRFSLTAFGLQAVHYSAETGTTYIDAYTTDLTHYIAYNREALKNNSSFHCSVQNSEEFAENAIQSLTPTAFETTNHTFRQYRLAMACTIEYAAFHLAQAQIAQIPIQTIQQQKAVVLSAMVATMTRVNFIFERDLSIRMNLVDNNDEIIFIDRDDFSNNNSNQLIAQSQSVINRIITSANYDIGHTVSTGGGGLARLEAPCSRNIKAMGITGSPNPIGDPFDVDYVAHEMGHQFGATHTFNNYCGGTIQEETAVETGSGLTIMAYAGICPPNVQANSNPFFHSISIAQINSFINNRATCSQNTIHQVAVLDADAGLNYNIPSRTPFKLTGTTTYPELNNLTYSWEQTDIENAVQPPVATATGGPAFKNMPPSLSNVRYFPNYDSVLAGTNSAWEVLSNVARTYNFSFLIRDNNPLTGGQTAEESIELTVKGTGPFSVTYPNNSQTVWQSNSTQTVTWNTAGTTANDINTSHVNILFSSDNGQTFIPLKENTPNDGSEAINIPDVGSNQCRILIEPVGNIYYAISPRFQVTGNTASTFDAKGLSDFKLFPNPTTAVFNIQFQAVTTDDVHVAIHDLGGRLISNQTFKSSADFNQSIDLNQAQNGIYFVTVQQGIQKEVKKIVKN
ncbi:reprolysin-like metallopeptidase [Flavobacterium sp. JP2137]|uniref:zinc-dependent metalloprotease n=1 Tax=Flavobacterium sp. JP2137 TaxID=3414510 RepID=UPI003D2FDD64